MADAQDTPTFDLKEQIARIDQLLADAARKRQEISLAPWQLVITSLVGGIAAGAGLFAAALAYLKFLGH